MMPTAKVDRSTAMPGAVRSGLFGWNLEGAPHQRRNPGSQQHGSEVGEIIVRNRLRPASLRRRRQQRRDETAARTEPVRKRPQGEGIVTHREDTCAESDPLE